MKIEENLEWEEPTIYINAECFDITITDKEIEIECDWDYGYGGRGTERVYIPFDVMEKLINKIKAKQNNGV